jgi:hypothetical protein
MRRWSNIEELANMILERGRSGNQVTLTADTALFIALKLQKVDSKPSRNDVARMLCKGQCVDLCYLCTSKANEICAAYGSGMD